MGNFNGNKRVKREISPTFGEDVTKELKVYQNVGKNKKGNNKSLAQMSRHNNNLK